MTRSRFRGEIAGIGSSSGTRMVVGRWAASPLGSFTDAMVETARGYRVLVAPSPEVAEFVGATYSFDEVRIEEVATQGWSVRSPSLSLDLTSGRRTLLGRLLRLVPVQLAESPAWCAVTDPVARVVLRGVRTRGTSGSDRREWYGATDQHVVSHMSGYFDGATLGSYARCCLRRGSGSPRPRLGPRSPEWSRPCPGLCHERVASRRRCLEHRADRSPLPEATTASPG